MASETTHTTAAPVVPPPGAPDRTDGVPYGASDYRFPHGPVRAGEDFHDDIPTDLPKVGTGTVVVVAALFLALLGALFALGYFPHRQRVAASEKIAADVDQTPVVDVVAPRRAESTGELLLPADARALQETSIYPRASGYLKKLLVDIGDHVKAGQLLAEIDTPEIDAQLNASRAALRQAQANLAKSKADLDLAQTTLKRYEEAAKTADGSVTQQDLDQRRSAVNQAESAVHAEEANVGAAQADVQRYTDLQGFQKVTAPIDGVVSARNYDVGALLSPNNTAAGAELFRITRSDTLRVFVNVPQWAATSIKPGQAARFQVRNFPGKWFEGKVTRTTGTIDPASRTLRVQVDIPNPSGALQAGMYGKVRLAVHEAQPPLLVPTSAMLFEADGAKVAVVDGGGKVKMLPITVGRDFGTELEVIAGLSGDERIISNPGQRLSDGVAVEVAPPQKAPAAPGAPGGTNPQQKTQQAAAR
jgi:RND family efflux transporter MFP subunit